MKFPAKKKKSVAIPTASMSDIAFLLIVFFMAVGKFDNKQGIPYYLPPAANNEEKKDDKTTTIDTNNLIEIEVWNQAGSKNINLEYFLYVDGSNVKADGVKFALNDLGKQMIKDKVEKNPDCVIKLIIDRDVEYGKFIEVMDGLRANKMAKKVSFERQYLNK